MPTDKKDRQVAKLLAEDDEYDDDFEEQNTSGGDKRPQPPAGTGGGGGGGGRSSFLADAAKVVAKEERQVTRDMMNVAAKEIKRATLAASEEEDDALALAAIEAYKERRPDDDDDDDDNDDDVIVHDKTGGRIRQALNDVFLVACFRGNMKQVHEVLDKGASYRYKDRHGWSGLHWAASSNSYDILRLIIKEAANDLSPSKLKKFVNGQALQTGWTPLMVAVIKSSVAAVETLLDCRECEIEKVNFLGETALECVPEDKSSVSIKLRKLLGVDATPPLPETSRVSDSNELEGGGEDGDGARDMSDLRK